jgi:hypothetical protein
MRTNYSHQTKDTLLMEFTYRIEALKRQNAKLKTKLKKYEKR